MAFVRVRLDITRGPEEEGEEKDEAERGDEEEKKDDLKSEQWEFLVRVAPPDAPGGRPRAAALRAAKLPSGPFGGSVAGISLSPGAEAFSMVGNLTAAMLLSSSSSGNGGGGEGGGRGIDETFVYPPPVAMA